MFSNQALKNLIIPLFLEQLLVAFVGIADVFVIGFVSEAAVSGVPLSILSTPFFCTFLLRLLPAALWLSANISAKRIMIKRAKQEVSCCFFRLYFPSLLK